MCLLAIYMSLEKCLFRFSLSLIMSHLFIFVFISILLSPNAVGKCTIFVPKVSADASFPLMGSHTDILPPALVARAGVRLEVRASLEQRRLLLLGAWRMRRGHFPKAEPGYGYQGKEMDAGAKTTDVCFKILLFRHNLLPKHNRIKQIQ